MHKSPDSTTQNIQFHYDFPCSYGWQDASSTCTNCEQKTSLEQAEPSSPDEKNVVVRALASPCCHRNQKSTTTTDLKADVASFRREILLDHQECLRDMLEEDDYDDDSSVESESSTEDDLDDDEFFAGL